jgi:hypothetical protein
MSSRRVVLAITGVYAVGVLVGYASVVNVLRLAQKHIDRGKALTGWSKVQIVIGHFFVQNGYLLLTISSISLLGLWITVGVRGAYRHSFPGRGND